MTSGQGGSEQEPTGPGQQGQDGGQGWNEPPSQQPPSYPAAPPAYPAAPPAAPPSYPPAPGAAQWGGAAPRPVDRPVTVRAGIGAFMANLILGVIGAIVTFTQLDDLINQALAAARAQGQTVPDTLTHDTVRAVILVGSIVGLVILGLEAMFVWFAWNGRNWARIVLWVIGGFGIISGLFTVFGGGATSSGFLEALSIIQFLLVLGGVILLALAPSNEWYRYRRWLRDTGQTH
ncbi:DUF6264 family protein [Petropleomorpha daqingensis]|uniref:Uncharacterized protein n=1 Tax=Petropleomorpha daqingensis TaxID=2026353 RepID=A0A853CB05_9ACTN|nr:DUF6264 family protein [Petropleomorpha daqingensis]NYJ05090.1 hypothetical protein [Petropleomorpha daqingensis]